jgi:hypothetical protein
MWPPLSLCETVLDELFAILPAMLRDDVRAGEVLVPKVQEEEDRAQHMDTSLLRPIS